MKYSKSTKYYICLICIIIIVAIVICSYKIGYTQGYAQGEKSYSDKVIENLNQYFGVIYNSTVKESGERYIDSVLENVSKFNGTMDKLDYIAYCDAVDFKNLFWEPGYDNENPYFIDITPVYRSYQFNPDGDLRAWAGTDFCNNSNWIAYYRTGACGELSYFFTDIANRSGFVTREIMFHWGDGNHVFSEVLINGTWNYYDPVIYAENVMLNKTPNEKWFGLPKDYPRYRDKESIKVYIVDTKENKLEDYFPEK